VGYKVLVPNQVIPVTGCTTNGVNCPPTATVSVTQYGAKCDGSTNDQAALQSAFSAAATGGFTLSFPTKAPCVVSTASGVGGSGEAAIIIAGSGSTVINVVGNGATILDKVTPSGSYSIEVTFFTSGSFKSVTFSGLNFTSQHTNGATTFTAIGIGNGGSDSITNVDVHGGTFTNYTQSVNVSGSLHAHIYNNIFYLANRATATSLTNPAQTIWMGANSALTTADTEVNSNVYNGCTANTTGIAACGDGLVFGRSQGWNVHDNYISNFSYEGVYLNSRGASSTYFSTKIHDNQFDNSGRLAVGQGEGYGVRSEENGAVISDNEFSDVITPITVDGFDISTPQQVIQPIISGNTMQMIGVVPLERPSYIEYGILVLNTVSAVIELNNVTWANGYSNPNHPQVYGIEAVNSTSPAMNSNVVNGGARGSSSSSLASFWIEGINGTTTFDSGNIAMNSDVGVYGANSPYPVVTIPYMQFDNVTTETAGSGIIM